MSKKQTLHRNQSGLVSIVVTLIIIFILSIIVLTFAQLVRREQRQALDRQLNTQALYAAESGVNDAVDAIATSLDNPSSTLLDVDYNECTGVNSFASRAGLTPILDGAGGVISYSCLLVDPSPDTLEYTSVPQDTSIVVPLRAKGGTAIRSIEISWGNPSGAVVTNCPAANAYPQTWPADADCDVGMLRAELVPFSGATSRDALITNRAIAFLQPVNGNTTTSFNFADVAGAAQGGRYADGCTPRCTVRINNIPAMTRGYLRLKALYRSSPATITAFDALGNQLELVGAQAEIDVTGKANDILRRIQVRQTITNGSVPSAFPEFALQSARTMCKRIAVTNTSASVQSVPTFTPSECNLTAFP